MDERAIVADRLQRKLQELHALEEKLRSAKIYVQALQDVMKALGGPLDDARVDTVLKSGSAVSQAREVILEAGKPVHISDLMRSLGREDSRESRASLASALAAYVRRGDIFTRPAPNTFGLAELGHDEVQPSRAAPPTGFGKDLPDEIPF
jgi:hypothetical protein